jgi:hypothetical protein
MSGFLNLDKICYPSIPLQEIKDWVLLDKCRVQKANQPYDNDWLRECIQRKYNCDVNNFVNGYGVKGINAFNQAVVKSSNPAQELFKNFHICFKQNVAKVYEDSSLGCRDIHTIAIDSYKTCLFNNEFCQSIINFNSYGNLWLYYADNHYSIKTPVIQNLMEQILDLSKDCGPDAYKLLSRQWKGKMLKYLE